MSKCWYCNSELTNGDNPKHFGICNNCYNEFEGADTVFHSLTNKITELQKQLKITETQNRRVLEKLELITKSNQELEKQLEGKEKELKRTTAVLEFYKSYYVSFNSKVSDELEKVKVLLVNAMRDDEQNLVGVYDSVCNKIKEIEEPQETKIQEQLKSQPLEIVEKIKKELEMNGDSYCEIRKCNSSHTNHQYAWFNYVAFEEFLITMLKEYQKEVK